MDRSSMIVHSPLCDDQTHEARVKPGRPMKKGTSDFEMKLDGKGTLMMVIEKMMVIYPPLRLIFCYPPQNSPR